MSSIERDTSFPRREGGGLVEGFKRLVPSFRIFKALARRGESATGPSIPPPPLLPHGAYDGDEDSEVVVSKRDVLAVPFIEFLIAAINFGVGFIYAERFAHTWTMKALIMLGTLLINVQEVIRFRHLMLSLTHPQFSRRVIGFTWLVCSVAVTCAFVLVALNEIHYPKIRDERAAYSVYQRAVREYRTEADRKAEAETVVTKAEEARKTATGDHGEFVRKLLDGKGFSKRQERSAAAAIKDEERSRKQLADDARRARADADAIDLRGLARAKEETFSEWVKARSETTAYQILAGLGFDLETVSPHAATAINVLLMPVCAIVIGTCPSVLILMAVRKRRRLLTHIPVETSVEIGAALSAAFDHARGKPSVSADAPPSEPPSPVMPRNFRTPGILTNGAKRGRPKGDESQTLQ